MSLSARERAVLDATAADLMRTTPALAEFLAEGPELLRMRGVAPRAIDGLVPDWKPVPRRTRIWRAMRPRTPRYMIPPDPSA